MLSVLALSAMVIRAEYGTSSARNACNRRTHGSKSCSSLYTGITMSRVVARIAVGAVGVSIGCITLVTRITMVGAALLSLGRHCELPVNETALYQLCTIELWATVL
ncbi:Uncharacterised protein [Mycobacteroides abscessus subsp. abscessus]|nr:Uncharacterised protein [Mycobacteroides abscessus subsp. abscessus]SHQ44196.1 Uncharacterised protein [Mycobacteroides abscessus subsp. abscessus]SHT64175.1 Uncharacterised protein [Mycobacteroides abscessus subsp. abscessus]SHV47960.1 Uncharacterised protein [Mycobacteroides abscessus subsp. abscessus]SHV48276.1 Uncharacterised protein [Mycobacteroides abscessus subsp. abscessus]